MSTHKAEALSGVKLAAGGLVWRREGQGDTLALVHRTKHLDWSLPKGKPGPGEALEDVAVREAQEETGVKVQRGEFAGSYSYLVGGVPKVVLLWHMRALAEPYPNAAGAEEILERVWLTPAEALARLTYPAERQFLAQVTGAPAATRPLFQPGRAPREKLDRLGAALQSIRARFLAVCGRRADAAGAWWARCVRESLATAEAAWAAGQLDAGWGAKHDAERFLFYGLEDAELLAWAASLRAEAAAKLKGWRGAGAATVFGGLPLEQWLKAGKVPAEARPALEGAMVEAHTLLHQHSDNVYHRMRLVQRQMIKMVGWCLCLLAVVLGFSLWLESDSLFHFAKIGPVLLAGGFGGVLSTLFQLSRVGEVKIPEALLHGLITSGRPLLGMVSALFVYVLLHSGVINLPTGTPLAEALVLGFAFVAGFTDRLVLSSVARLAGEDKVPKGDKGA